MKTVFPMARKSDPETSHLAAEQHVHKLSNRRWQVYTLVHQHPGRTSGELSRLFFDNHDVSIRTAAETPHKRLPELESLGYVVRGERRRCADSGYQAYVWFVQQRQQDLF
jgi:hypothetical protein